MCLELTFLTPAYKPQKQDANHAIDSNCQMGDPHKTLSEDIMKNFTLAALLFASFIPATSQANLDPTEMEHINVTYRTPFEYSLYQYTSDTLQAFNQQLLVDIHQQAKQSSQQMAKSYSLSVAENNSVNIPTKALVKTMTLESAE